MIMENLLTNLSTEVSAAVVAGLTILVRDGAHWLKTRKSGVNIEQDLAYIKQQLTLNGGSTLRDEIQQLRENQNLSLSRWRLQANQMNVGIFETSPEGECTYANKYLCDLFGMDRTDMEGRGWLKAVGSNPKEREDVWETWKKCVDDLIPYDDTYTVVNQKTGQTFKCKAFAISHKTLTGKPGTYSGTIEIIN